MTLPGSHLAEVDCADCGRVVFAVPAQADQALCAACWREKTGATVLKTPPPPSWFGHQRAGPQAPDPAE